MFYNKMMKRFSGDVDSMNGIYPFGGFKTIMEEFSKVEQMFSDYFGTDEGMFTQIQPKQGFPKLDVVDSGTSYEIEAALAGYDKDDVNLEIKDNSLFIKVEKKTEKEDKDKKYLMKEISKRSFHRGITFPAKINIEDISSSFQNGVLKIHIGKMEEKPKNQTVKIEIK